MASVAKRKRTKVVNSPDEGQNCQRVTVGSTYFTKASGSDEKKDVTPAKLSKVTLGTTLTSDNVVQGGGDVVERLTADFYNQSTVNLAKALLGQKLVHRLSSGKRVAGIIVETEAYCGLVDKAAHSYNGKRTARTEAMFMKPGTAYVYSIYGLYCCMNISSQGEGCAVLLRAIEPVEGKDQMRQLRTNSAKSPTKPLKEHQLGNGPSKICMALGIKKEEVNRLDLTVSKDVWLEKGDNSQPIVISKRINISYGEDWVDKPLRFYLLDNKCVSVRDKEAENLLRKL
ncbi:DNA-3-methyladenine glycosylase-like [Liolophura sinensis]|uniref:DNA-3-methyladenine glycosylase-like n=1 Tax=Liolophura sinensis TaxID=3198878 RepID=UPI003158EA28